jgi:hypothetical protein
MLGVIDEFVLTEGQKEVEHFKLKYQERHSNVGLSECGIGIQLC